MKETLFSKLVCWFELVCIFYNAKSVFNVSTVGKMEWYGYELDWSVQQFAPSLRTIPPLRANDSMHKVTSAMFSRIQQSTSSKRALELEEFVSAQICSRKWEYFFEEYFSIWKLGRENAIYKQMPNGHFIKTKLINLQRPYF